MVKKYQTLNGLRHTSLTAYVNEYLIKSQGSSFRLVDKMSCTAVNKCGLRDFREGLKQKTTLSKMRLNKNQIGLVQKDFSGFFGLFRIWCTQNKSLIDDRKMAH